MRASASQISSWTSSRPERSKRSSRVTNGCPKTPCRPAAESASWCGRTAGRMEGELSRRVPAVESSAMAPDEIQRYTFALGTAVGLLLLFRLLRRLVNPGRTVADRFVEAGHLTAV